MQGRRILSTQKNLPQFGNIGGQKFRVTGDGGKTVGIENAPRGPGGVGGLHVQIPVPDHQKRLGSKIPLPQDHLNQILRSVSIYLNDLGLQNLPVPLNPNDVDESLARKAAALRAGLGWLGKNDRVVHRIYGSQTVSCRIYVNADLPVNTHIRQNQCGDCRICVDSCPVECLKNKKWSPRVSRKDVIDEATCLEYRSRAYSQTGRYTECDRCVRCCPGKK